MSSDDRDLPAARAREVASDALLMGRFRLAGERLTAFLGVHWGLAPAITSWWRDKTAPSWLATIEMPTFENDADRCWYLGERTALRGLAGTMGLFEAALFAGQILADLPIEEFGGEFLADELMLLGDFWDRMSLAPEEGEVPRTRKLLRRVVELSLNRSE